MAFVERGGKKRGQNGDEAWLPRVGLDLLPFITGTHIVLILCMRMNPSPRVFILLATTVFYTRCCVAGVWFRRVCDEKFGRSGRLVPD